MLILRGLSKSLASHLVLDSVDFEIPTGTRASLIGPSGVGKTTLLRIVAGLEYPDGGEVHWQDRCLVNGKTSVPPWERNIGMVFQDLALWSHMTVKEHLRFAQKSRKSSRKTGVNPVKTRASTEIQQILEMFHIESTINRRPAQLSGGQQQRLALARAIIARPEILLLDEPFAGLDPMLKEELWRSLIALQKKEQWLLFYVSHDIADALFYSHNILLLYKGKIKKFSPEQIEGILGNDLSNSGTMQHLIEMINEP